MQALRSRSPRTRGSDRASEDLPQAPLDSSRRRDHGHRADRDPSSRPPSRSSHSSSPGGAVISMVRSLPLAGCWMLTHARRLLRGSKYKPVNSDPRVPFDAQRTEPFAGVGQVAIEVQIARKPDVVVGAAVTVLDDVDVAVVADREVVWARKAGANRHARGESIVLRVREYGDRLGREIEHVHLVRRRRRHVHPLFALAKLNLHVLGALIVGTFEGPAGSPCCGRQPISDAVHVGDRDAPGRPTPVMSVMAPTV